jgi:hypothetical protein
LLLAWLPKEGYPNGPEPPSSHYADAATQLHQTGHASIAQHFRGMKVGSADDAAP